jgi:hypothetical protein
MTSTGLARRYPGRVLRARTGLILLFCTCIGMGFRKLIRKRFGMRMRTCQTPQPAVYGYCYPASRK